MSKRLIPKAQKGQLSKLVINGVERTFPRILGKLTLASPEAERVMAQEKFVGEYLMEPGPGNEAFAGEQIRRLLPYLKEGELEYIQQHPDQFIDPIKTIQRETKRPVIFGHFTDKDTNTWGFRSRRANQSFVGPNNTASVIFHENNMHGTDEVVEAYAPQAVKSYQSFADNIFNNSHMVGDNIFPYTEDTFIEGGFSGVRMNPSAKKAREVRATFGEILRKLYYEAAHRKGYKGISGHIEELRPDVESYIDSLNELELADLLKEVNGYGRIYGTIGPKAYPKFLDHGKQLLKYAPIVTPFVLSPFIQK